VGEEEGEEGQEEVITADQLVCHGVGDYLIQTDQMAQRKTSSWAWALYHALSYSMPFWLLHPSVWALAIITGTHALIDRYRLARYVVFGKNFFLNVGDERPFWKDCSKTGMPEDRPPFLTVWLLIIVDNLMHIIINGLALRYL
jgi:hypothetical protein